MTGFLFILSFICMAAVVIALVAGLFAMGKGGDFDRKYSNRLMRARIYAQGLAILFFVLAILSRGG